MPAAPRVDELLYLDASLSPSSKSQQGKEGQGEGSSTIMGAGGSSKRRRITVGVDDAIGARISAEGLSCSCEGPEENKRERLTIARVR